MRVNATRTSYEEVDIPESEIIRCTLKMFDKKYKLKGDYIDSQGYWMIFDYCHPHNGEDHYRRGDLAPPEDRMLLDIRTMISELDKS